MKLKFLTLCFIGGMLLDFNALAQPRPRSRKWRIAIYGLGLGYIPSPPGRYYGDNSGSYLLDVFVFDNTQMDGFKKFLRALIRQNPEDTVFSA